MDADHLTFDPQHVHEIDLCSFFRYMVQHPVRLFIMARHHHCIFRPDFICLLVAFVGCHTTDMYCWHSGAVARQKSMLRVQILYL